MHKRSLASSWMMAIAFVIGALLMLGVSATLASPPAEPFNYAPTFPPTVAPTTAPTVAPTVAPTTQPTPGTPAPSGGGGSFLAVLEGYVWEEGDTFRPLANVKVRYTSDGVNVDTYTDSQGYFRFVNVGPDNGVLELDDPKWQSGTGGVVIMPPLGQTVRVNLAALPKGKTAASQVTLSARASAASAAAGQTVTFTLKVTNGTKGVISGLMLGDQIPDGMAVSGVATSRGDVLAGGPGIVMVDLNALAAGDSATVTIVALVNKDMASSGVNRATLLYREGPAISAQMTIGLTSEPATLPVTGIGVPIVTVVALVAILLVARRLRMKPAA